MVGILEGKGGEGRKGELEVMKVERKARGSGREGRWTRR